MNYAVVGIIGSDSDAADVLYTGLRVFPAEEVILVHYSGGKQSALSLKRDLEKIKIPVRIETMEDTSLETVFQTIYRLCNNERGKKLVLNIDTDYKTSCIALSAAFVNGVQAIGVNEESQVVAYPIMKFSYYSALSEKKMGLLRKIEENKGVESLEEISQLMKMSLPLVTYHVRGSKNSPGLEQLGLVETKRNKGRIGVMLTSLGRLILNGYVEVECNTPQVREGKQGERKAGGENG